MPFLRTSYDTARSDVDYDANRLGPLWGGGVAVTAAACWVSDMVGFRTLPQAGLNVVEAVHGIGGASHGPQDGLRGTRPPRTQPAGKENTPGALAAAAVPFAAALARTPFARAAQNGQAPTPVGGAPPCGAAGLTAWSRKYAATVEQVKTCEGYPPTALRQRPECVGWCALGIPRKADTRQWQVSRAALVQPRPRPRGPASVAPRSHHGFQRPD
jgi:hypothetical protein